MTKTYEVVRAETLYVERFMTGIGISEELDVSLTNVYRWIRKYGWKAKRDDRLRMIKELGYSLEEFQKFVDKNEPELSKSVKRAIRKYKKSKIR
jgi:hypothetical protein